MKTILFISPGLSVKGGISSVMKGYLCSNLRKKYNIYLVASHTDGKKFTKLIIAILGLFKTFFISQVNHLILFTFIQVTS